MGQRSATVSLSRWWREYVRLGRVAARLDEQGSAGEFGEDDIRVRDPETGEQGGIHLVEPGSDPEDLPRGRRLAIEDLLGQVVEQSAARLDESLEGASTIVRRLVAERLDDQPNERRPALGDADDIGAGFGHRWVQASKQGGRLLVIEAEPIRADLDDLALAAQALDRERDLLARGDHDMQRRRRTTDQCVDEPQARGPDGDLVQIVDHEDGVS